MTKKTLNQNAKFVQKLEDTIEPDFVFGNKPLNRFKIINKNEDNLIQNKNKTEKLLELKKKINSIENCNLKDNSKNLILGDGDINSPIVLIGETPGEEEDSSGQSFQGNVGDLLKKMLLAINIKKEKIYSTYSINFRPPKDRKPTSQEIKRYSTFLKEHIAIINPKIIILLGSTAMEAMTGLSSKISDERGNWKEIILKNKTYPLIITFSPSYLIRFPENKKYSWEDLKKIRQKIKDLNIEI
jgi:DNA polymerase